MTLSASDVRNAYRNAADALQAVQDDLFSRLGVNSWSDALAMTADVLGAEEGLTPEATSGDPERTRECHPELMRADMRGNLPLMVAKMLSKPERISYAASGAYFGSGGTAIANLVQMSDGNLSHMKTHPMRTVQDALRWVSREPMRF